MTTDEDMRAMVLSAAAATARRCVDAVKEAGLVSGNLKEEFKADDVTWEIAVFYGTETELVSISGSPVDDEADESMMAGRFVSLFGQPRDENAFTFQLPPSWLPSMAMDLPTT
jgi:hypothetical protein